MSKKHTELAKDYFDRHPQSEECHITADGRVFHNAGTATGFANTLKNTEVEAFKASEFATDVADADLDGPDDDAAGSTDGDAPTLENFNPESANAYPLGVALLKQLEIKPESNKKEHVFAAIAAAQAKLNA